MYVTWRVKEMWKKIKPSHLGQLGRLFTSKLSLCVLLSSVCLVLIIWSLNSSQYQFNTNAKQIQIRPDGGEFKPLLFKQRHPRGPRVDVTDELQEMSYTEEEPTEEQAVESLPKETNGPMEADKSLPLDRQHNRKQQIIDTCGQINDSKTFDGRSTGYARLIVNDELGFMYCMIPKVASTNWKKLLLLLSGKINISRPEELLNEEVNNLLQYKYLKFLSQYSEYDIQFRLNNYYKFLFVREPFERLLSAYREKLASNNTVFEKVYGPIIAREFRNITNSQPFNDSSAASNRTDFNITFDEFIRFILNDATRSDYQDVHWRSYYKSCNPCSIQYDFVGKYETLSEDIDLTVTEIGARHLVGRFPPIDSNREKTRKLIAQYYVTISAPDIHRLWKTYQKDYTLFGYPYPNLPLRLERAAV